MFRTKAFFYPILRLRFAFILIFFIYNGLLIPVVTARNIAGNSIASVALLNVAAQGCTTVGIGDAPLAHSHTASTTDCFTFSGTSGDRIRVYVVVTSGTVNPDLEILRPNSTSLCSTIFTEIDCTLDASGTHTVNVTGSGTGGYTIVIQRLNNPIGCTVIAFGNPPLTPTYTVGEQDCFTFTGAIGDEMRVYVVATSGTFNPDLEIIRPNGTSLCSTIFTEITCLLDANGSHTIIIDGSGTGNYTIHLQRLNNPATCTSVSFGNPPITQTNATGEQDCFTFSGAVGDEMRVYVVVTSGTFNPDLEITRPDGTTLCSTIFTEITCLLDANGSHTIIVDGSNTGGYTIHLQRLNNPATCTSLIFGTSPPAQSNAVGEQDCFTFSAASGDQVKVVVTTTSGTFNPDLEFIRPNGTSLCSTIFTDLSCLLDANGTHTVIVDGSGTGNYTLTLQCVSGNCIPSPPSAAPPINIFDTDTPVLTWNRVLWAAGYEVQVNTKMTFALPDSFHNENIPASQLNIPTTSLSEGTYYWRVRAKDSAGHWGAWSALQSFTIIP